jgi:NAD+ synthase
MDLRQEVSELKSLMEIDPKAVVASLKGFVRDSMENLEREGIILGLSGGIDSALTTCLCSMAVGKEKVLALIMPEKHSEARHIRDALHFAKKINVETRLIDITPYLKKFGSYKLSPLRKVPFPKKVKGALTRMSFKYYEKKTGETPFSASISGFKDKFFGAYLRKGNAYYRIKHRIRMVLLYHYAELENRLVVGAANKTEYMTGFFVKHGCDDSADIMPLLKLYKTQVRELARFIDIPVEIRNKPPSPDIIAGITDEQAIGVPYETLDLILLALEKGWDIRDIAAVLEIEEKMVSYVKGLTLKSEHMRKTFVPDF